MNKQQTLGIGILGASAVVLILLFIFNASLNESKQEACALACVDSAEGDSCTAATCPFHSEQDSSWLLGVVSVLVAFLGGVGFYLMIGKKEEIITQKSYDLSNLTEEEQKIFQRILQDKEGVFQSTLAKEFQLSKVKMTRLLDKFEGLGLVERKRRGMSNIVLHK